MYKAIQTQTNEEIIILHPTWRGKIEQLCELDKADQLVCQGCGQPLHVKAVEVKRPHFAHKHLQACSLGSESAGILIARAVVYEFLLGYFGQGVTLEKQLANPGLPRPVDCWVETPAGSLAYWVIETGVKTEPREAIKSALTQEGIHPTWIMLQGMLNEEKKLFHSLLLTPTERVFLQVTPFDQALAGTGTAGGSLNYLDAESAQLTTYRNLILHHRPNWYKGLKKTTALAEVLVDRRTGHLIHPGEERRLQSYLQHQQRLSQKRQQLDQRESDWDRQSTARPGAAANDTWGVDKARKVEIPADTQLEALECVQCGQMSGDYWMTFFENGRKLCRCRSCLDL